jgi:DNA-binding phage protein
MMATTRDFGEWVQGRVRKSPEFAEGILREGINAMLVGEVEAGRSLLRDYIKGTIGFEKLGEAIGVQPKSLIRMFGPKGNPQANNLFSVISYLQKHAGLELQVA